MHKRPQLLSLVRTKYRQLSSSCPPKKLIRYLKNVPALFSIPRKSSSLFTDSAAKTLPSLAVCPSFKVRKRHNIHEERSCPQHLLRPGEWPLKGHKGFTLIDVCVLMIVLGLLVAAFYAAQKVDYKRQIIEKQLRKSDMIISSLRDFVNKPQSYYADGAFFGARGLDPNSPNDLIGGRYPCPAQPNSGQNDPAFGREAINLALSPDGDTQDNIITTGPNTMLITGGAPNGTCILTGGIIDADGTGSITSPDEVIIGTFPFKTVGLNDQQAIDVYHNQYTYAITAGSTAWQNSSYPGQVVNKVIDETTGNIVDPGTPPQPFTSSYAIVSHGEDGRGAYSRRGGATPLPCTNTVTLDDENCDGDDTFVIGGAGDRRIGAPGTGTYFDDFSASSLASSSSSNSSLYWEVNGANNIYNINNNNNGNVGIGTGPASANNISLGKLSLTLEDAENIPHLYLTSQGSNNASLGGAVASDSFAVYLQDYAAFPQPYSLADNQAIVFENLDSANPIPDDSIYFINTGVDGIQEMAMLISGQSWVRITQPRDSLIPPSVIGTLSQAQNTYTLAQGGTPNGFVEMPYLYTRAIEAATERNNTGTGILFGGATGPSAFATGDEDLSFFTQGLASLYIDNGVANVPADPDFGGVFIDVTGPNPFFKLGTSAGARGAFEVETGAGGDYLVYANFPGFALGLNVSLDASINGSGSKVIFDADTGTFRAGVASGAQLDTGSIGYQSIAIGNNNANSGNTALSIGHDNNLTALAGNSFTLGENNTINANSTYFIGESNSTLSSGNLNIAFGRNVRYQATTSENTTVGNGTGTVNIGGNDNFTVAATQNTTSLGNGSDSNVIFLQDSATPPASNTTSAAASNNFIWSASSGNDIRGEGNIALIGPESFNSDMGNAADNSMGVFLASQNSTVNNDSSVAYFLNGDNQTLPNAGGAGSQNKRFLILGDNLTLGVGIGTLNPGSMLDVNGVNRAENHIDSSDRRWKTDIKRLSGHDQLESVLRLRPVRYTYKDSRHGGPSHDGLPKLGFIAQEVEKVYPELTSRDEQGYYGLDITALYAPLAGSLANLEQQKDILRSRLEKNGARLESAQYYLRTLRDRYQRQQEDLGLLEQAGTATATQPREANISVLALGLLFFLTGYYGGPAYGRFQSFRHGKKRCEGDK